MPPIPKPEALRQRKNRSATIATLPTSKASAGNKVPPLPDRPEGWHRQVVAWWESAWRSPMASEWLRSDMVGGLYEVAVLRQDFWTAETPRERLGAAGEIRLQEVRFGLSPIDRRRLQWTIEQGEEASEKTAARRQRKASVPKPGDDPRNALRVVG